MVQLFNMSHDYETGFDAALAALRSGGLVAVPTETVYGLGANATDDNAVEKIFQIKGRPGFNPLIAHVSGLQMAERYGVFDALSRSLAAAFWPGPLTLVVELKPHTNIASAVCAGLPTIALRQPRGTMAELASHLGAPIAAPSANTSGRLSPTRANHVLDDLGDGVDVVLDGGSCMIGVESTIIKVQEGNPTLLREGGIAAEDIEAFLGIPLLQGTDKPEVEAPGMLLAHYAPKLPIRLNAKSTKPDEALLAFGTTTSAGPKVRNLSVTGNIDEAARNLFAMLKELDATGATSIAVHPIPETGLGAAINDRLKRAAQSSENGS